MKGYQRGEKPNQVKALADADRKPYASQDRMHMERPEGGSVCINGRRSYQLTEDVSKVNCKWCLKLMGIEEKK